MCLTTAQDMLLQMLDIIMVCWVVVTFFFNPSTQEGEAVYLCEFKASLLYRAAPEQPGL